MYVCMYVCMYECRGHITSIILLDSVNKLVGREGGRRRERERERGRGREREREGGKGRERV